MNSSWGGLAPSWENRRSLCSKVLGCWLFCRLWEGLGTAKVLATEAWVGVAKERLEEHMLESLVAHLLVDLAGEWDLHRHRYEHPCISV